MYKFTVKNQTYTIPKATFRFLAIHKAMELNKKVKLNTNEDAIKFFKDDLGIEVEEL